MSSQTPSRQPKGVPVGGQFTATQRTESAVELTPPVWVQMGEDGYGNATIDVNPDGTATCMVVACDPDTQETISEEETVHASVQDAVIWAQALAQSEDWRNGPPEDLEDYDPTGAVQVPICAGGVATIEPADDTWSAFTVTAVATDPDTGSVLSEHESTHPSRQAAITYIEGLRRAPEWQPPTD